MPYSLELPGMLGAVVPLVRGKRLAGFGRGVVRKLVADLGHAALSSEPTAGRLPRLAAIVGSLNHLSKPAASLRSINPIRIGRRSLQVIHLPTGEVWAGYIPLFALSIRRKNERAFARAN